MIQQAASKDDAVTPTHYKHVDIPTSSAARERFYHSALSRQQAGSALSSDIITSCFLCMAEEEALFVSWYMYTVQ